MFGGKYNSLRFLFESQTHEIYFVFLLNYPLRVRVWYVSGCGTCPGVVRVRVWYVSGCGTCPGMIRVARTISRQFPLSRALLAAVVMGQPSSLQVFHDSSPCCFWSASFHIPFWCSSQCCFRRYRSVIRNRWPSYYHLFPFRMVQHVLMICCLM